MDDKAFDGLNMVPFIDIMLVLLTIVLTTSSFVAAGRIPVNLPQASGAPADAEKMETIAIDAAGIIHHGGDRLTPAQLKQRLAALDRGAPFLLRADRAVPLQRFIDVADALKQAGVARVAVQTEAARR